MRVHWFLPTGGDSREVLPGESGRAPDLMLARGITGESAVAGFTVGERAWTLQAHPEFVAPLADHLLARRIELIGAERVATARESLVTPLDRAVVGSWIATFFAT